jgi:hypothetical protein
MKQELTASAVFSSMSVFDMLRSQLHIVFYMIPRVVQGSLSMPTAKCEDTHLSCSSGKVSLDRVNDFLVNVCFTI